HHHNNFIPLLKRLNGASLIGSSLYADSFTLVKLQFKKIGTSWVLQQPELKVKIINTKPGNLPLDDASKVKNIMAQFCKKYDHQLGKAEFKGEMEINDFLKYILEVLRYEYRGELSILDKNTLHQENFPLEGKVTAEQILRAVNSNSVIVTARIKGSDLKTKLNTYLDKDSQLMVLGLEKKGKNYYINKRKIQDDQHYKLVTTKYIITGGGGYLTGITQFSEEKNDLRKLLLQWFKKTKTSSDPKKKYLNLKSDFPDFGKNYVLFGATNVGINFGNITTTRSGLYEENSQLAKENLRAVTFDFTLSTGISSLSNALSFTSRMQYGKTWTKIEGEEGGEALEGEIESADEIKLNLLYQWKYMKKILFNKKWWAPIPFLDGGWTTEFTPSLDEESSRYKLGTIIGGIGLEVWKERLFLKIGAGKREEYGENGFTSRNALYGGWELINGDLGLTIANLALKGESRLDGFIIDDNGNINYEFKAFWKIYLAFSERLFFNLKCEYYLYKEHGTDWASVFDIQAGVSFQFDSRIPFFI
ncbi:MAG: 5'-nucleotidase C-terminal domain-containing protein, partial [Deltaproteobacteria bacterium]|nr:5'-nucleotidase C-terminal domain-containing protein [Deltaproteobacteria bacterium]